MPLDSNRNWTPPAASGYFPKDVFNYGAGAAGIQPGVQAVKYDQRVVDTLDDGQVIHWRVILEDTRGGLNATKGNFDELYDRVQSGDADTRFFKTLILPQLRTAASTPDPSGTLVGVHSLTLFNRLMIGLGSGNGASLFRETSISSPVITATSYNAGSAITGMAPVVIGGASAAQRLAICRAGGAIQIISDSSGTVAGTMHSDTNPGWGVQQTFVNEDLLLIYANGAIRTLPKTAAITDQPDVGLSNVPNGGFSLGMIKFNGAPIRPAWMWPLQNTNGGMLAQGSEAPGRIVTTNSEADDYQEIPFGLPYCFWAVNYNNSAVITSDQQRIMYYDGKTAARDLGWIRQRSHDSSKIRLARNGFINGNELWVEVQYLHSNLVSAAQRWYEVYNFETNSWHQASAVHTMSTASVNWNVAGGSLPLSQSTGFTHQYIDGAWHRQFIPVYGYNPYDMYRSTDGGNSGYEYEATATYNSPAWELPGLEGWPKITTRVLFLGNVDAGGSGASVAVTAGNLSATFLTGLEGRDQVAEMRDNQDLWYKLNVQITMNRTTSSTRFTPNALPMVVEGYAFVGNNLPLTGFLTDVR